jgi:hypothetical protein
MARDWRFVAVRRTALGRLGPPRPTTSGQLHPLGPALKARGQQSRVSPGVADLDRLVYLWEEVSRQLTGRPIRLTDRFGRLSPRNKRAFERLAAYLAQRQLPAELYMRMIRNRAQSGTPFKLYTTLLGTRFYNQVVEEQLVKHEARRGAGQATNLIDQDYDRTPDSGPTVSNRELENDVKLYLQCRRLYRHLPVPQFWLLLQEQFSGAFLYVWEEFRQLDEDLKMLSFMQQRQYDFLARNPDHAEETRVFCLRLLAKYGQTQGHRRS